MTNSKLSEYSAITAAQFSVALRRIPVRSTPFRSDRSRFLVRQPAIFFDCLASLCYLVSSSTGRNGTRAQLPSFSVISACYRLLFQSFASTHLDVYLTLYFLKYL